jgi:hypothetical protein
VQVLLIRYNLILERRYHLMFIKIGGGGGDDGGGGDGGGGGTGEPL